MIYITYAHFAGEISVAKVRKALSDCQVPPSLWPEKPRIKVIAKGVEKELSLTRPGAKVETRRVSASIHNVTVTCPGMPALKYYAWGEQPDSWLIERGKGGFAMEGEHYDPSSYEGHVEALLCRHSELFDCARDLGTWFYQEALRSHLVPSVARPGGGGGAYLVPDPDILLRIAEAFNSISAKRARSLARGGQITLLGIDRRACDLDDIIDPLVVSVHKSIAAINQRLKDNAEGVKTIQSRGYKNILIELNHLVNLVALFDRGLGGPLEDLIPLYNLISKTAKAVDSAEMGASIN